jgi:hypothetical protein
MLERLIDDIAAHDNVTFQTMSAYSNQWRSVNAFPGSPAG